MWNLKKVECLETETRLVVTRRGEVGDWPDVGTGYRAAAVWGE